QVTTISRVTTQTFSPLEVLNGGARAIVLPDTREFTETESVTTSGIEISSQANRTWKHVTNCNAQYGYVMGEGVVIGGDGGEEEDTTNQFLPDSYDKWLFGLKTQSTVTYSTPGRPDITEIVVPAESRTATTSYDPDPDTGAVRGVTREPSGDA